MGFENNITVSLVDVSLSTEIELKVSSIFSDKSLIEPICQASMINIHRPFKKELLAFSNPNSKNAREKMTIQFSLDQAETWSQKILIHKGPSAYSNLVQLSNNEIACLFEGGIKSAYEGIAFQKINIRDIK